MSQEENPTWWLGPRQPLFGQTEIPENEILVAADALKACWECDENQQQIKRTGFGVSYMWQAFVALKAAAAVRGRVVLDADYSLNRSEH